MDENTTVTLLEEKRLNEIVKLVKDAHFGYATVNNQVYFRDVSLLLADRELWMTANGQLASEVRQLKKANADLGMRLDEALRARQETEAAFNSLQ